MAPENENQNGGQGGEPNNAGGGQNNQGSGQSGTGNDQINDPAAKARADEEYRYRTQNRTLQEKLDALQPQLDELGELRKFKQELEDRDKSELDKATGTLQTVTQERDTLKVQVEDLQLKVGILTADDATKFHNPLAALKFVPDYKPELGADGKVTNLGDILTAVAKDHPYLLKTDSGAGDEGGEGGGNNGEGSSGANPSGSPFNKKKDSGSVDREYLENKFPALRGR